MIVETEVDMFSNPSLTDILQVIAIIILIGYLVYMSNRVADIAKSAKEMIRAYLKTNERSSDKCQNCDTVIYKDDIYCYNCSIQLRKTCKSCGTTMQMLANFCPHCGERVYLKGKSM